jgi:hypothetical protein
LVTGGLSLRRDYREPCRAFTEKLDATLPEGTRVYVYDSPGCIAFYSHVRVTPADGLVNSYRFNDEILRDGFLRYAHEHNINYFHAPLLAEGQLYNRLDVQGFRHGDAQVMAIDSPLYTRTTGWFALPDSSLVMRATITNPYFEREYPEGGLWDLRQAKDVSLPELPSTLRP